MEGSTSLTASSLLTTSSSVGSNENDYELFGKGSTTTTSSAGTVIYRSGAGDLASPAATAATAGAKSERRRSAPPEPPPRTCTAASASPLPPSLSASESKEICDALNQLRMGVSDAGDDAEGSAEAPEAPESETDSCCRQERIRVKTEMSVSRIPAMCVVTPPPSDDETANQPLPAGMGARVDLSHGFDPAPVYSDTHIVIKASVGKPNSNSNKDGNSERIPEASPRQLAAVDFIPNFISIFISNFHFQFYFQFYFQFVCAQVW